MPRTTPAPAIDRPGKPKLSVLPDERCGSCVSFLPGQHTDALGECFHFVYVPKRYPNQVCAHFSKKP